MARQRQTRIAAASTMLLLMPCLLRAQSLSIGVAAGVPLNDLAAASAEMVSDTGRYTFGPSVQLGIARGFAVDVGLLYKHFDIGFASAPARIGVHRLELPVLVRYGFARSSGPFLHAGISFDYTMPATGKSCPDPDLREQFYCIDDRIAAELRHGHTRGAVLGAGFQFGTRLARFAPEVRITRWVDRNFGTRDSPLRSELTQLDLLLNLNF